MFLTALTPLFTLLAGVLDFLNGYALVYVGVTGEAFWPSAKRAVRLAGKRHQAHLMDCTSFPSFWGLLEPRTNAFSGGRGQIPSSSFF